MGDAGFTALTTARLVIRRFVLADAPAFATYRSDPTVARYQSWQAPYPEDSARRFIESMRAAHPDEPGEWFQLALARRDDPHTLIGDLALGSIDDGRQAEIGFTLAPAHQGVGYATEAVEALLAYLFGRRGKHRVQAGCDGRNTASARLLERVGFRLEGHLIESYWDGERWTDDLRFGLLRGEWAQRVSPGTPG
jgi:RimJ/RimL family protein N-acetyltransferase